MGRLRSWILDLSRKEAAALSRFGSSGERGVRARRERVMETFLSGYRAVLEDDRPRPLAARLGAVAVELQGFAYEGAALGLRALDLLTPWRRDRFGIFLAGPGRPHAYMMHVGAGLILGRLPLPVATVLRPLDPMLRWAAVDGYGFYEGFARLPLRVERHRVPRRLRGYAERAFDFGLGRSLWFSQGADVARVVETIAAFPPARHADLWSGVGIACSYTGWVDRAMVEELCRAAAPHRPQLAQGTAISAWARRLADNPTAETEMACQVLCACSAERAAAVAAGALEELDAGEAVPEFEIWRQRMQGHFAGSFAAQEP